MRAIGHIPISGISKKFAVFSLIFLAGLSAFSENFRVRKLIPMEFTEITEKITVESGINDAVWITLPPDLTYISGVELQLKVPEEIVTWRDSVAYMLYEKIEPLPTVKNKNYYGERVYLNTIPGNFSLTLYIPISDDFSIKDNPYSVKLPISESYKDKDFSKSGIFLRFMMVMKGVPESLEDAILRISAKPVLNGKGALNLTTTPPASDEKKYSVFIDDVPASDYGNKILSVGEHHLSVVSDSYRNELRTFRIDQAKTTVLSVRLRGIEPLLRIICPRDTNVFLDDSSLKVTSEPIVITQGEHSVKFILGDYEVVKTVSAQNGRTYSVSLNVDATVSEEE